eukprot:3204007-Pyramimonas_sp.AAC.1
MEEVFGEVNPKSTRPKAPKPSRITAASSQGGEPKAEEIPVPLDRKKRTRHPDRMEYEGSGWWSGEDDQ